MIPTSDETILAQVRSEMLLDESHKSAAFFATCAFHLQFIADRTIDTLFTDGTVLKFNPDFVQSLSPSRKIAAFAHEVAHDALLHPYRRGSRDLELFNIAADHVVNIDLKDAGFDVGPDWYCDEQYRGWSVDQVYSKLAHDKQNEPPAPPEEPEPEEDNNPEPEEDNNPGDDQADSGDEDGESGDDPGQDGDGEGDPGDGPGQPSILPGCESGSFGDADTTPQQLDADGQPGPPPMTAEDWAIVAEEAAMAGRQAGTMGGGIDRALKSTREVMVDWQQELKQFITQLVVSGQSWSVPNRRFVGADVYLPGNLKDTVGEIAVIIDTSGSVDQRMLNAFASHLNVIASEVVPERIHVIYCDHKVQGHEVFEHGDDVVLTLKGGGGTLTAPAQKFMQDNEIEPLVVIWMTDLEFGDVPADTGLPYLWVTPLWVTRNQPFGDLLRVDIEQ